MSSITRRSFLAASAAAAGVVGLAGCNGSGDSAVAAAPAADSYPIDPDGEGVEAKWTSEEVRDGWTRATNPDGGQEIGVKDPSRIIQVDGLAFRDMDGDGKLSLFEDWRQSADDRAADLASKLDGQACINLMWHGGVRTVGDGPWVEPDPEDFSALEAGSCAGCSRLYADGDSYASAISWINQVQEICENRPYGIPYINSTDPYRVLNIPNNIGLAALMDHDMWRKAGMWTSRTWRRTGVRVELGPQVDLYTQPTADRLTGGVTEDPILSRDFIRAFVGGMQSTWGDDEATDDKGWGGDSVGSMMKHYVGPGSIETGCDDHNIPGKYCTFPTGGFNTQLIAYLDGGMKLDSQTGEMAAIMTNYGISWSEDGEYGPLRGGAYNGPQISILRNAGWGGMVCTDWSVLEDIEPLNGKCRGVEDLTMAERYRLMLDSGVDQYGERWYGDSIGTETYEGMVADLGEDAALERVRQSARNIFKLMVNLDLFDQPYSDRSQAAEVFESEAAAQFSLEANEKSVVMVKNAGGVISDSGLGEKPKVYVPQMFSASSGTVSPGLDPDLAAQYFDVITDAVGDPTGPVNERSGETTYQESDITRLGAGDLTDVAYAIVHIDNPQDAYAGTSENEDGTFVYHPVSLQYRPYTADGDYVRKTSLSGDPADGSSWDKHDWSAEGVEIENRSHYGQSTYATNESDLDLVIDTKGKLPEGAKLICVIDINRPMIFSELEPYADVILLGWTSDVDEGITDEAFLHIINGDVEPYGLLPYQMPSGMETVETQMEDVPRDMECYVDSEGNTYDFAFGLNWAGVIDDERTKTYMVNPVIEPETEVVRSEA